MSMIRVENLTFAYPSSYRKEGWQATTLCWIFRNRRLQTAFLPEGRLRAAGAPQR